MKYTSEIITERLLKFRSVCIEVTSDYNTYNLLFNENNREILTSFAPIFFNDLARILHRDWLLQVSKMFDPPETVTGGYSSENLTFDLIKSDLLVISDRNRDEYEAAERAMEKAKKIKPYIQVVRNKLLAHNDLRTKFSNEFIGAFPDGILNDFLIGMQEFCDSAGRLTGDDPLCFKSSSGPGDVLDFLKRMRISHRQ